MKTKEIFEKQWTLFRQNGECPAFKGERPKASAEFDGDVKVGQIRIFADMNRPFTGLVADDRGISGWRIVPVSPFAVPASARERVVGERVFQLWNACTAARSFVERSWIVDEVPAEDVERIRNGIAAAHPGRITAGDGAVSEYEKAFLVSGGSFVPLAEAQARGGVVRWRPYAWSAAAMLMLCLGATWMLLQGEKHVYVPRVVDVHAQQGEAGDEAFRTEVSVNAKVERRRKNDFARAANVEAASCSAVAPASGTAKFSKTVLGASRSAASRMARLPAERYAEYSENEFLDPRTDPLSTFSLDVDTSSYTIMRQYITERRCLPPAGSVRAEEYINYFKYDYPQPKGADPIAVDCELAGCPWNAKHRLLRVGLQAKRIETDRLPPCNLTFLIDTSGSMSWNGGMEMVKGGMRLLVNSLRDGDHVSIVTYANGAAVRLPSTPGSQKGKILAAIDSLMAHGGTAGGKGVQLAYDEAKRNFSKTANNRVILVTDGDFNIGISSPVELEKFISQKRDSGIFLSVFGVGNGNYHDAGLKKLANAGNGNYAYLDSLLEAKKVMMTEFGGTLFTVAKDVKLQVEFNPSEVAGYRLIGYENRMLQAKDFNDDRKDAGEIGSGHTMTALYEIIPSGTETAIARTDPLKYQRKDQVKSDEMFTLKMRWKAPDGDRSVKREVAHRAAAITREEPSEDFRFASAVAEYALILQDSKFKADASFGSVLSRARKARGGDDEGYRAEFIRLVELAELIYGATRR